VPRSDAGVRLVGRDSEISSSESGQKWVWTNSRVGMIGVSGLRRGTRYAVVCQCTAEGQQGGYLPASLRVRQRSKKDLIILSPPFKTDFLRGKFPHLHHIKNGIFWQGLLTQKTLFVEEFLLQFPVFREI
jgi:hypothetical protein